MSQPEPAPLPSETLILETPSPTRSNQVQPDPIRPFAPAKTHRRSTDETPESQQARLMMRELSRVQSLTSGSVSSFDHLTNDLSPQYPFECVHSHILDQLRGATGTEWPSRGFYEKSPALPPSHSFPARSCGTRIHGVHPAAWARVSLRSPVLEQILRGLNSADGTRHARGLPRAPPAVQAGPYPARPYALRPRGNYCDVD